MTKSFSITGASHHLLLKANGQGECVFTITNTTPDAKRIQLNLKPQASTNVQWLQIAGGIIREFSPNETQQVTVQVVIPQGTPKGTFPFRLDVVVSNNPNEDYTEGPPVIIQVSETKVSPKQSFPWWIPGVIAAVLVIGGLVWWFWPQKVFVNSFVGQQVVVARENLETLKLKTNEIPDSSTKKPAGEVIDQDPKNTEVNEGDTINLTVVPLPLMVEVPSVKTRKFNDPEVQESLVGLTINKIPEPTVDKEYGIIVSQFPKAGNDVVQGTEINITVTEPLNVIGFWFDPANNWYYEFTKSEKNSFEIKQYMFKRGSKTLTQTSMGTINKKVIKTGSLMGEITSHNNGIAQSIQWQTGRPTNRVQQIPETFVTIEGTYEGLFPGFKEPTQRYKWKRKKNSGKYESWSKDWEKKRWKGWSRKIDVEIRGLNIVSGNLSLGGGEWTIEKETINDKGEATKIIVRDKDGNKGYTWTKIP